MELTLKRLLEQAEFTRVKRGYDTEEVDDFLDRAVAMATKVEVRLTQAIAQAKAAEDGSATAPAPVTETPGDTIDVEAEVERRVQARLAEQADRAEAAPAAPTGPSAEEIAEESRRTLLLAQRTADDAVREARDDAARLVSEAEASAAGIRSASEAEATAARAELADQIESERQSQRQSLEAEIGQLEGVRTALRTDLSALERHVEEQRSQLRSSVGELQRLLDDPTGFRMAPAPATIEPPEAPSDPEADAEPGAAPDGAGVDSAEPGAPADEPEAQAVAGDDGGGDAEFSVEPEAEEAQGPAGGPKADAEPPSLTFDDVDHEAPGDAGPPTAELSSVEAGIDLSGDPVASPSEEADAEEKLDLTDGSLGEPTDGVEDSGRSEDDPFLSELRRAIGDEEPLGPRSSMQDDLSAEREQMFEGERRPWRFGKRR